MERDELQKQFDLEMERVHLTLAALEDEPSYSWWIKESIPTEIKVIVDPDFSQFGKAVDVNEPKRVALFAERCRKVGVEFDPCI